MLPAPGRGLVGGLEETAQEADLPSEGRTQPALPHPPHWDGLLSPTPEARGGLSLVQTTDLFYPLVEDLYSDGAHRLCERAE